MFPSASFKYASNDKFEVPEGLERVVVIVSWISIHTYENELSGLERLLKSLPNIVIDIVCAGDKEFKALHTSDLDLERIYHLDNYISEAKSLIYDFQLVDIHNYLTPVFFKHPHIYLKLKYGKRSVDLDRLMSQINSLNLKMITLEDKSVNGIDLEFFKHLERNNINFAFLGGVNIDEIFLGKYDYINSKNCFAVSTVINSYDDLSKFSSSNNRIRKMILYFELNKFRFVELFKLCFFLIFTNYKLAHFYYYGKRSFKNNILVIFMYCLSFINLNRTLFMLKIVLKPNNLRKISLKIKRIVQ